MSSMTVQGPGIIPVWWSSSSLPWGEEGDLTSKKPRCTNLAATRGTKLLENNITHCHTRARARARKLSGSRVLDADAPTRSKHNIATGRAEASSSPLGCALLAASRARALVRRSERQQPPSTLFSSGDSYPGIVAALGPSVLLLLLLLSSHQGVERGFFCRVRCTHLRFGGSEVWVNERYATA